MRTGPDAWVNVDGDVAAPNSPAGGGGPGYFALPGTLPDSQMDDGLPHPLAPAARTLDPLDIQQFGQQLQAAAQPKPAPRVTRSSTQTINGMQVTVRADATGASGIQEAAKTTQDYKSSGTVIPSLDANGRVVSFTNTIAYAVTIQTQYGTGNNPNDLSAYGRGTTDSDKRAGDVTLGFHESCHRSDYLNYLRNTPGPQFGGRRGMSEADFQQAITDYGAAWTRYFETSEQNSLSVTDEVGNPTRTAWCSANPGSC